MPCHGAARCMRGATQLWDDGSQRGMSRDKVQTWDGMGKHLLTSMLPCFSSQAAHLNKGLAGGRASSCEHTVH